MDWDLWIGIGGLVGFLLLILLSYHRRWRLITPTYGPVTRELVGVLHDLRRTLVQLGDDEWFTWVAKTTQRFQVSDYDGIDHWLCIRGEPDNLRNWLDQQVGPLVDRAKDLVARADELVAEIRGADDLI